MCGWIGAMGLLTAFYLNSTNKINTNSKIYQWLNFFSALLLLINAFYINAYPFIIINIFWAGVALLSVYRLRKKTQFKVTETNDG